VDQQPASTFHSPILATEIQPYVSNCNLEQAFYYQPSRFYHLFYDPVGEYMELFFLNMLKPPRFILPSSLGGNLKDVITFLSQFCYPLLTSVRVNKFSIRKLFEWLWWKFIFTYCIVKSQLV
jgi:hypothetical protein